MEPNIPAQTTPPMAPEIQTPVAEPIPSVPSNPSSKTKYIILGVLILFILIILGGGTYYLGVVKQQLVVQKDNKVVTATTIPPVTPIPSLTPTPSSSSNSTQTPTPTTDPTANWKTYSGQGISYKYPANWQKQYNYTNQADTMVYEPNSMKTVMGNGGTTGQQPTIFFDVQKVTNTTQTAKLYVDNYTSGVPYNTSGDLQRQSKLYNDIQMELFTAQGEGNFGKFLILSNGTRLIFINTSLQNLNGNEVENQILLTFKFTQ